MRDRVSESDEEHGTGSERNNHRNNSDLMLESSDVAEDGDDYDADHDNDEDNRIPALDPEASTHIIFFQVVKWLFLPLSSTVKKE